MQDSWTDGDDYEAYVGRWSRKTAAAFLSWLDAPLGLRWLDLGCGTGALTERVLAECEPRSIVGVEPSEDFLKLARERTADSRVQFAQGNGHAIPLEDRATDIAVSGLVLNFIPDKAKALAELMRCVDDEGTVAAYLWDYAGHAQFIRYFWDAAVALDPSASSVHEGNRFPICNPAALETLFTTAGLRDVALTPIDIVTPFSDFDDYWKPFLSGVGPAPGYCMALDPERRQALRSRLAETLPSDPDGRILLAARAWAVRGTKPSA